MSHADEMAAKIEPSAGAVASSIDQLDEQLRLSVEALVHPSPPRKPVEELDDLLSAIANHLDQEASERKAIYDRLRAIDSQTKRLESQTKRRASRAFVRYLIAICIGVAGTLAWQSYGEATKQIIASRAPELGWSPDAKQMIANWAERLGWTKPPAGPPENTAFRQSALGTPEAAAAAQTALENLAPKAPAAPSLDPAQVEQITQSLAALRQTVVQLAASQDRMAREMARLESDLVEILLKVPESPRQRREGR